MTILYFLTSEACFTEEICSLKNSKLFIIKLFSPTKAIRSILVATENYNPINMFDTIVTEPTCCNKERKTKILKLN